MVQLQIVRTWEIPKGTLRSALKRPSLEDMKLPPEAVQKTIEVFGAPLPPAEAVQRIVADVARRGDAALVDYALWLDGCDLRGRDLFVSAEDLEKARLEAPAPLLRAVEVATRNIKRFHEHQVERSWFQAGDDGSILGQHVVPIERVGMYIPGGRAPLLSTIIMCAVPAMIAGVNQLVMATPAGRTGEVDARLLAVADSVGIRRVLKVGGAQAVAALAFGTESVPKVDKIVGPGNVFVQLAKKLVFGHVGIDSLAGPSEVLVIADLSAPPKYVAADMISQAEHSPDAAAVLLTPEERVARAVSEEISRQLEGLPQTVDTARASLEALGRLVVCRDLDEAYEFANEWAPEHLELMVSEPFAALSRIRNAGAVFLGPFSAETAGDYLAGPNHVLPTNGGARFASALSVWDFQKRSSVISLTPRALSQALPDLVQLARAEGLEGHAAAAEIRERGPALEGPDSGGV
ncbi:MAG: histidinol dehydrogenase [Firmicutes bacterium]|nr:histidinol dehydrogenase [Bacillota bacterium]